MQGMGNGNNHTTYNHILYTKKSAFPTTLPTEWNGYGHGLWKKVTKSEKKKVRRKN